MKTFILEMGTSARMLISGEPNLGQVLVDADKYENGNERMIREAFDFAVNLLKKSFSNVKVTETSASVEYDETIDKKPEKVVDPREINNRLVALGYRRKIQRP